MQETEAQVLLLVGVAIGIVVALLGAEWVAMGICECPDGLLKQAGPGYCECFEEVPSE